MKLTTRVRHALKAFNSTPQLSNSLGSVLRNYAKPAEFRPQQQFKGITAKAIERISQSVSLYEAEIENAQDKYVANHPLYNIIERPNPRTSGIDFITLWEMNYQIYGEAFLYLVRGDRTNKVKELYLLNPAMMELIMDNGELVGYVLHKTNGSQVPFTLEEIYHDKSPNPFNEWRGMSIMEKAAAYIDTEITTTSFTLNYINNSASPSGIVSLPNMSPETFRQFTQQWREGYEGPENAGKTAFIRGGEASFKAVGATLQDIDQKVTREMAKDDVLMMFGMPRGLLGMSGEKGLGKSELEPLEYVFAKYTIEPLMKRKDSFYSYLLTQIAPIQGYYVHHKSIIPEDADRKLKRLQLGTNVWMTINEARAIDGLPPIKGGDELKPDNTAPKSEPQKSAQKIVLKKSVVLSKADQIKKEQDTNEQFRKDLVKTNDLYADKIKTTISKFANSKEKEVIGKINASTKIYDEWLFNVKESSEELAAMLSPLIIELMQEQSKEVSSFITGELLTITDEIRASVEADILRLAGVFNADTITALEKTLTEGQTAGESLVKLKKRVESVFEQAKGYRAERIARTESLHASNRTAEMVYKQNGFNSVKWFVNPGACEFCQTYSGRVKEIGSIYTPLGEVVDGVKGGQLRIEYSDIDTPPLHPSCKCSIIPES